MKQRKAKFWAALILPGLIGQIAWTVENMYLNVFIYKMFAASAADISRMVALSAVTAAITTVLIGALCDRVGRLRTVLSLGYIAWGITILAFGAAKTELLLPIAGGIPEACALGVNLVIALDCLMTFFGSSANDAAYNAWLTEVGDGSTRGKLEGIHAMMPLIAILAVFGGFMGFDLDVPESWDTIFLLIGCTVIVVGIGCFFLLEEKPCRRTPDGTYCETVLHSFRLKTVRTQPMLYLLLGGMAIFGISIQVFMPYLIIYYEKTLGMTNYVFIFAPAIVLASAATALYGRLHDMLGFQKSVYPPLAMLLVGYAVLFFTTSTAPVFLGSLLMLCGYLCGMAVFGAEIRARIPENMAGRFQGVRIIGGVLIPGVIGPAIGAAVLAGAETVAGNDGTYTFLPNRNIWPAAAGIVLLLLLYLALVFRYQRHATNPLRTEAAEAGRISRWDSHPKPQMRRERYFVLADGWTLNGLPIRVPYPPESELSGYTGKLSPRLVYEVSFSLPESFTAARTVLHFGAVDQTCTVYLNGHEIGTHEDGYLDFSFDITDTLLPGENRLRVIATDRLDRRYPYGKQTKRRGGMWYTPLSGIWQSVWLENVPERSIRSLSLIPDLGGVTVRLDGEIDAFTVTCGGIQYPFAGNEGYLAVPKPHLWTVEDPYLYEITVTAGEDTVKSYFALRTVERQGNKLLLNGRPIFLHGVLDQGYFPEGLFLPAEEEEYLRDIRRMKALGFNTLRKHIKIEPEIFYYYCDSCGMLVLQDMVNSGGYSFIRDTALPTLGLKRLPWYPVSARRRASFERHMEGVAARIGNHPSIVMYTVFNEGWGQFDADAMYEKLRQLDGTRPIDTASGWFAAEKTDFDSRHIYFKTLPLTAGEKPLLLSECGGYTRTIPGHVFSRHASYGYGGVDSEAALSRAIVEMYEKMVIPSGACGCIYTQLSDVEDEINGLYTYDRRVCKVDSAAMRVLAEKLYKTV